MREEERGGERETEGTRQGGIEVPCVLEAACFCSSSPPLSSSDAYFPVFPFSASKA